MYRSVILLLVILLLASCQTVENAPKPKNLIPEDTMVELLVDLGKINALISINAKQYELRDVDAKQLVFDKYNIDSTQLVESARYYAEHFRVNQNIYNRVNEILQRESDSLYEVDQTLEREEKEKTSKKPIKLKLDKEKMTQ